MKETQVTFVHGEPDWTQIPRLPIDEQVRPLETDAQAYAQICYSNDALYIQLCASEVEIRKEEIGILGMPCNDSCLEFFFRPMENDLRYFNFEFNPNGCLYLGFGSEISNLIRFAVSDTQVNEIFSPKVSVYDDYWNVCFCIPYRFIQQFFPGFAVAPNKVIRGNFYKCGDLLSHPHYLAWSNIVRDGKSLFHTPEQFGVLRFI